MELDELITALLATRAGSQLALRTALEVLATDGAAGTLTIHIPRKGTHLEVALEIHNPHPDRKER